MGEQHVFQSLEEMGTAGGGAAQNKDRKLQSAGAFHAQAPGFGVAHVAGAGTAELCGSQACETMGD
jgi:hypothetical protein